MGALKLTYHFSQKVIGNNPSTFLQVLGKSKPVAKNGLNYFPFGMLLPGRNGTAGDQYKYGFGGMEKDDEIKGAGNSYTAEFWQYDPRLGRRWNRDPIVKHHESPYAAFANSPIYIIDPNGLDSLIVHRSAPVYSAIENINIYQISISVVQNGQQTILPYQYEQSAHAKYIQMPENSTLEMEFKAMGSGAGNPDYDNTIFVNSGKQKPNGEDYYTFMHPGAYGASWLLGCMITAENLLPNGAPDIGDGEYYGDLDYGVKATALSVEPLNVLKDLYLEYSIGDDNGVFEGNAFIMQTNSVASQNVDVIKMKQKEIKLIPTSSTQNIELVPVELENPSNN